MRPLFQRQWGRARGGCGWCSSDAPLRHLLLFASLLVLAQLILGATMRHQHAGLAIPDFPLAYGKLWPAMDPQSVTLYNQHRQELLAFNPITSVQIGLQMTHRLLALAIFCAVAFCAWTTRQRFGPKHFLSTLALAWLGMILVQALLGAATIWSNKAADIATAHVLIGALSLATGALLTIIATRANFLGAPASLLAIAPNHQNTGSDASPSRPKLEPSTLSTMNFLIVIVIVILIFPCRARVFSLSSFGGEGWGEEAVCSCVPYFNDRGAGATGPFSRRTAGTQSVPPALAGQLPALPKSS